MVQRLMFKIEHYKTKGKQRFTDFGISGIKSRLRKRLKLASVCLILGNCIRCIAYHVAA